MKNKYNSLSKILQDFMKSFKDLYMTNIYFRVAFNLVFVYALPSLAIIYLAPAPIAFVLLYLALVAVCSCVFNLQTLFEKPQYNYDSDSSLTGSDANKVPSTALDQKTNGDNKANVKIDKSTEVTRGPIKDGLDPIEDLEDITEDGSFKSSSPSSIASGSA